MTNEQILDAAREAGFEFYTTRQEGTTIVNHCYTDEHFFQFAQAVRHQALEEAAAACVEEKVFPGGREPCCVNNSPWDCEKAIRALIEAQS